MRENPIPLFVLFLLIGIVPMMAHGQDGGDPPTEQEVQRAKLERIKKMTARGPHRKNPLAAGRLLVLNARSTRLERVKRRRIPHAERRERRSTFTSLSYRAPTGQPGRKEAATDKDGSG